MLLKWYDPTYKSYYGLRAKVKTVTILFADEIGEQLGAEQWLIEFDTRGRVSKKTVLGNNSQLESIYYYKQDKTIKIVSKVNGKLWRSTEYDYNQNSELSNIRYIDNQSQQTFEQIVAKHAIQSGWFRIYKFVDSMEVPQYHFFNFNNELVWSSKLIVDNDANNYLLDSADRVSSATVENPFQTTMRPVGGYVYEHNDGGRLSSIISFNSNDNGKYYNTDYIYDNMGLLLSEKKEVVGKSVFNNAVNAIVTYRYDEIDNSGNWLKRKAFIKQGNKDRTIVQRRKITYY